MYSQINAKFISVVQFIFTEKKQQCIESFKKDYQKAIEQGPWFWGRAGLFLTP